MESAGIALSVLWLSNAIATESGLLEFGQVSLPATDGDRPWAGGELQVFPPERPGPTVQ
jgi:hypothetical protein